MCYARCSSKSIGLYRKNCIINTSSVIEHDCVIEDNTHISPKSVLGGGVKVGKIHISELKHNNPGNKDR